MDKCEIFEKYQKKAEEITLKMNQSQHITEKAKYAQELLDLEKELQQCFETDDPKCRLQRRVVVPMRRKVAMAILRMFEATGGKNG